MKDSDMEGSVGYSGIIFSKLEKTRSKEKKSLSGYEKEAIIATARGTVLNELSKNHGEIRQNSRAFFPIITPELSRHSGAFVTIETAKGELRGCIGRTFAQEPLVLVIEAMARAAAFHDSRFKAVTSDEIKNLKFSVTVLSAPISIKSYKQIELGKHGIILEKQGKSAVFLPDVPTGQGWSLEETLKQLSLKAKLESDAWKDGASFMVFEGTKIKE
jgi:AmmeMemoRadiSam system protein A